MSVLHLMLNQIEAWQLWLLSHISAINWVYFEVFLL